MFHATNQMNSEMTWNDSNPISRYISFFPHQTLLNPAKCNIPPKVVFTGIPLSAQYLRHELWIDRCSRHPFLCPASQILWRYHLGARALQVAVVIAEIKFDEKYIRINWKQPKKKTSNILKLCHISVWSSDVQCLAEELDFAVTWNSWPGKTTRHSRQIRQSRQPGLLNLGQLLQL